MRQLVAEFANLQVALLICNSLVKYLLPAKFVLAYA